MAILFFIFMVLTSTSMRLHNTIEVVIESIFFKG